MSGIEPWWQDLRTAALVGSARRDVPPLPPLGVVGSNASREQRLLESAALGDVVRRAGRVAHRTTIASEPAPSEDNPAAEGTSAQLLTLLLQQPPVSARHRIDLLAHWMRRAATADRLVPPASLVVLLDTATQQERLRHLLPDVVGRRGHWLASHNPTWSWLRDNAVGGGALDHEEWARLGAADRVESLAALRRSDPAAGRELAESTWASDAATERAAHVGVLVVGLSSDDEAFLESCLDDRSKNVRDAATRLLDRLSGSGRATRMAARLRPLLSVTGTVRRSLDVALPDDPDPAGVRDGLVDPGGGRSRRAWWLRRLVVGAPLSVWTEVSGQDSARTLAMLRGGEVDTVLPALREAARLQRDADWVRALLPTGFDTALLGVLPRQEQEQQMDRHVRAVGIVQAAVQLGQISKPWGPSLSRLVVDRLRGDKDSAHAVRLLRETLVDALHPESLPRVETWLRSLGPDDDRVLRTTLRDTLQYQSLRTSISEALP